MAIVSSTDGSPTKTGWKRRSSAASFSMCLRYSSSVVAPTTCSSPRANAGFSMLEASIAPSAAPRQRLHHAADLLVPPDDGVDLALARQLGEVARVALERLVFLLGLLVGHTVRAAHALQRRHQIVAIHARGGEELFRGRALLFHQGEEQMLGRHVRVAQRLGLLVGAVQDS